MRPKQQSKGRLFTFRLTEDQETRLERVSKQNALTRSAVARMAIERGLEILAGQLSQTPNAN